ncbi:Thiolase, C-terminal domain [Geosmithia morbida]|uniref:Thiolase, C-terminal domain n=1 Tax=Geosmithia morbida TaxID=1094350 RepID=A0A9P4YTD0_9HYPO|nr:Thiolase, C-terminal domain [Geosmithia morbida]KAF4122751.1 Thiolase, C-terminal domain [Geosmithia morbida]
MSSDSESETRRPNGVTPIAGTPPLEPSTPPDASQVTLPSTEAPPSPTIIEASQSFQSDIIDGSSAVAAAEAAAAATTVIPSSLTPPPSTQVQQQQSHQNGTTVHDARLCRLSPSQESSFVSPPATVHNNVRDRDLLSEYSPPSAAQMREASADQLRAMLTKCIDENKRLKMETAHHRLQYNLLNLQATEDAKRSEVELEMLRKEIDALRDAEHTRQARHELSSFDEAMQTKYLDAKADCEEALSVIDGLERRLKNAKRIIQDKDGEVVLLIDERARLLNRIRENREHTNKLRSPGGIFHAASRNSQTQHQHQHQHQHEPTPSSHKHQAEAQPRSLAENESGHGLSTLIEALSQDNNSEPSTPVASSSATRFNPRSSAATAGRRAASAKRHTRNAQSMSSLPTTPISQPRGPHALLLPSADLVPQTEPPQWHDQRQERRGAKRRGSRESTISAEAGDSEGSSAKLATSRHRHQDQDTDVFDSQASRAATELLRRQRSLDMKEAADRHDGRLLSDLRSDVDKRRGADDDGQGSPLKKSRVGGGTLEQRRLGLGIQHGQ